MTVYFLDEFNGSGPLSGHVPDVNLASGAAWQPRSTSGSSGTAWQTSGGSNAVLAAGALTCSGNSGYFSATMLNPGRMQVNPYGNYPQLLDVYTNEPCKVSWSWTPARDSSAPFTVNGSSFALRVGSAFFRFQNTPGATKNLIFGGAPGYPAGVSVPVGYQAGVTYQGSMEVRDNEQTMFFMGQTIVYPNTGDSIDTFAFGDIYLNLDYGNAIGFIKVESLAPNLFWTQKVGCTES